jgi:nucleoside-diphosphate-sugar epimerase
MCWGDIRQAADIAVAVVNQEVVVHLAAIIPELSHTGERSEDKPDAAFQVNVGGMKNLIAALQAMPVPASIVFTSTLHVYGLTQHLPPPRSVHDPVKPVEYYAKHKVACEALLRDSGLRWAVLRLGAAIPIQLIMDPAMFLIPLTNRIEYVHTLDVGVAIANAIQTEEVFYKTLLIGGGERCQLRYGDMLGAFMQVLGQAPLPQRAFNTVDYSVDWLDTRESQQLLKYQQRTYDDYVGALTALLGPWLPLVRWCRPVVRWLILRQSPYF